MIEYKSGLPVRTARIEKLPLNDRGYPIPWFVAWLDPDGRECSRHAPGAKPDFRIMAAGKLVRAVKENLCWICGERLGSHKSFVIGPMCAINRVSAEPPSHTDCARYAGLACPFLTIPKMERREIGLPLDRRDAPGFMIARNPGVALVWTTHSYTPFRPHAGGKGVLFHLGPHVTVEWFAEGREATRAEVLASIDGGYPALLAMAEKEGAEAVEALGEQRRLAEALLLPLA